jgi:hypothetical protein
MLIPEFKISHPEDRRPSTNFIGYFGLFASLGIVVGFGAKHLLNDDDQSGYCNRLHGSELVSVNSGDHVWREHRVVHGEALATFRQSESIRVGNQPDLTSVCVVENSRTWLGIDVKDINPIMWDNFSKVARERIEQDEDQRVWFYIPKDEISSVL